VASQFSGVGTGLVQAGRDVTVNYLSPVDGPPVVPHQVPVFVEPFTNRCRSCRGWTAS
jgi:nitrate reductase cytochrome c-type subunit